MHSSPRMMIVVAAAFAITAFACIGRQPDVDPSGIDPKLSLSSYVEEGDLVALIVGTRPAIVRPDRPYVPLEVAVANKGLAGLTLSLESFALRDDEGREYPAVERGELERNYGNVDLDRRFAEIPPFVMSRFSSYTPVRSVFTPSFDRPIARRTSLPRFSYLIDFLYFPMPDGGIAGRKWELVMTAPELSDAIFVRFEVQGSKKE